MHGRCPDPLVQARRKPRAAGDISALLTHLADASADYLPDGRRLDASPYDKRTEHVGEQVRCRIMRQTATTLADSGAHRLDDHNLGHPRAPTGACTRGMRPRA